MTGPIAPEPDTSTSTLMLAAFEGWNDAGDAASSAVRWFSDRWEATPFADIDPEVFYDFTSTRPEVRIEDALHEIVAPDDGQIVRLTSDGGFIEPGTAIARLEVRGRAPD